jgi:hypothetical protein
VVLLCRWDSSSRVHQAEELRQYLIASLLHKLWALRGKMLAQFLGYRDCNEGRRLCMIRLSQPYTLFNFIGASDGSSVFDCELIDVSSKVALL